MPEPPGPPLKLNDTGAADCVDALGAAAGCPLAAAPGQDAEHGRDAAARSGRLAKRGAGRSGFDFTKIGADGEPLVIQFSEWEPQGSEDLGSNWACVRDNVSGLVWEIKNADPASERFFGHTYSWHNVDEQTNGGVAGERNLGQCAGTFDCDTAGFITAANEAALCGRTDWRLPSVTELLSIVDHSLINPPVDSAFFPNVSLNAHWTSVTVADNPMLAWYVYFTVGTSGTISKSGRAHIRLVSGDYL